jgi:glycerol-3-phosphate O-acyltransferase
MTAGGLTGTIAAVNSLLRRILGLWVRIDMRPEDAAQRLTASPLPVCYVIERRSVLDLAALQMLCKRANLPRPARRLLGEGRGAVRSFFAVYRTRSFWDGRIDRRPPEELQRLLERLQREPAFDVSLVPVAVYWGRAPQKQKSLLRLILSENWALSGSLRKFFQVVVNGRQTLIELGDAISLRSLAGNERDLQSQGMRIGRQMRSQFRRQRAARIGPDLSHRRTILARVINTAAVRRVAAAEAREKRITRRNALLTAHKYGREIAANYSHTFVIFTAGLLSRLWNRLYDGVEFNHAATLREVSEGNEIVFVPCHRSHMDYLLLSYAIFVQGYAVPHIAAGINLNLPIVGRYLRKGGAFFIRRSFRGNALYTVVFMKYLAAIMARGHSVEYFIEGGRSRTGRLLQPKTGMLSMTVRSFLRDPLRPVVFVPVYFGYERLVEANTYISELSGRAKQKESWRDLLRAVKVLKEKFGRVHVNIGEPIFLAATLDRHQADWRTQNFDDDTRAGWVSRAVDDLAAGIMRNINAAAAVTPVNLLGMILLATPRQAMLEADLLRQLDCYLALVRQMSYSPRVTVTPMTAVEIVQYGLAMQAIQREPHSAGELIRMQDQAAILAAYYRNNVLHLFALPSLLACSFGSNAVLRTEDLQRLVWRVYPYISAELFLRFSEEELPVVVAQVIEVLASQSLLEKVDGADAWRRPAPNSMHSLQLSNLAQATIQTIERYYLAIALLRHAGSGRITAKALIDRCRLMAQRITMLYGFNSPEFSDRSLFENFIELLIQRAVIDVDTDGNLIYTEVLERVAVDAELVLSEQIRHSILQVTHH